MNERKQDQAEVLRNEAINMYLQGEKITDICRTLGRSRPWFYKTLERYRQEGRAGRVRFSYWASYRQRAKEYQKNGSKWRYG